MVCTVLNCLHYFGDFESCIIKIICQVAVYTLEHVQKVTQRMGAGQTRHCGRTGNLVLGDLAAWTATKEADED